MRNSFCKWSRQEATVEQKGGSVRVRVLSTADQRKKKDIVSRRAKKQEKVYICVLSRRMQRREERESGSWYEWGFRGKMKKKRLGFPRSECATLQESLYSDMQGEEGGLDPSQANASIK